MWKHELMLLSILGPSQIMFNYIVHPQYFKVQFNVFVISLIINLIILCICFFSILVLYASLVHMIHRLFLKYRFSLAPFACS